MPREKRFFPDANKGTGSECAVLFHRLNNQLGIILANAELLEQKLAEQQVHRVRAAQIVSSVIDAISTARDIREHTQSSPE
mgnify:FL=1|tara:strand:- start:109 stop:351 length:243 start_codon:yes stop_codon:yes gene_type:complete